MCASAKATFCYRQPIDFFKKRLILNTCFGICLPVCRVGFQGACGIASLIDAMDLQMVRKPKAGGLGLSTPKCTFFQQQIEMSGFAHNDLNFAA